jgi:hypothetical protein
MHASLTLEEFLARRDADLATIVRAVISAAAPREPHALIAVGSLVEGLGTTKSDLDLVMVAEGESATNPPDVELSLAVGTCLVDVRLMAPREVVALTSRFEAWRAGASDLRYAAPFTLTERTLLHRLAHGNWLLGTPTNGDWRIPSIRDLARLKYQVARQAARTIQVDMVGSRDGGDDASLVFASQDLLGHAADALLAGCLVTNPLPKWRSRLLAEVPSNWEVPLGGRNSGELAVDRFWNLHRAPERPERVAAVEHALRVSTFARRVFAWTESVLLTPSVPEVRGEQLLDQQLDESLPWLELDVDFARAEDLVAIARLNEFGRRLTVSPKEFGYLLWFDGRSSPRDIGMALDGDVSEETIAAVRGLESKVRAAGLSARP